MRNSEHNPFPDTQDEAIGIRIRNARKSLHLTQEELARRIGVSTPYISCLERGQRPLTHHVLPQLLSNLHLSYEYLVNGTYSRAVLSANALQKAASYDSYFKLEKLLDECTREEYEICYQLCRIYLSTSRRLAEGTGHNAPLQ